MKKSLLACLALAACALASFGAVAAAPPGTAAPTGYSSPFTQVAEKRPTMTAAMQVPTLKQVAATLVADVAAVPTRDQLQVALARGFGTDWPGAGDRPEAGKGKGKRPPKCIERT